MSSGATPLGPAARPGLVGRVVLWCVLAAVRASLLFGPRPAALLVRKVFAAGGRRTAAGLARHAPAGVASILDERYGGDADMLLDVHRPESAAGPLPLVVWIRTAILRAVTDLAPVPPGVVECWLDYSSPFAYLGTTQIERMLRHATEESKRGKINAMVFIGDAVEESHDAIAAAAGQLGLRGVPVFVFHEGGGEPELPRRVAVAGRVLSGRHRAPPAVRAASSMAAMMRPASSASLVCTSTWSQPGDVRTTVKRKCRGSG